MARNPKVIVGPFVGTPHCIVDCTPACTRPVEQHAKILPWIPIPRREDFSAVWIDVGNWVIENEAIQVNPSPLANRVTLNPALEARVIRSAPVQNSLASLSQGQSS